MDPHRFKASAFWNETGAGTTTGVSTTHAAVANRKHTVTSISGSGDAAAVVTVESPAATILWQKRFAGAFSFTEVFPPGEYEVGVNAAVLVKVSASTTHCEANIAGYSVPA